ncbi:heavy-metal transporter [Enterococcus casseliflavus]|uniref:heavy-metal transporter n=1 Tax=Enterococcus casseliflavus TaxID=37734 RepID=UPI00232C6F94|nr:heavy-metal transporter [Enterococcus casseliflavus]MDB1688213.1 heavy-metal transporter [Enterococcus casseliflavus]
MTKKLQTVVIKDLKCSGCADTVKNALEVDDTISVKIVDLARGTVTLSASSKLTLTFINQLLKNTRYKATKDVS